MISFGNIMFSYEYLFSHFSPLLGWNIAPLQNNVLDKPIFLVHLFLPPVKDDITCRHYLWHKMAETTPSAAGGETFNLVS